MGQVRRAAVGVREHVLPEVLDHLRHRRLAGREPRWGVDQGLAQAAHAGREEAVPGPSITDAAGAGAHGQTGGCPGDGDQAEPVDGAVVSADEES